jgi:hypothetical protein
MEELQKRAFDLLIEGGNDFAGAAKLQFTLSTGAVVLFVHTIAEFHHMPVRTGILTLATLFFGFAAIKCIRALIHLSIFKVGTGVVLWQDVEKRGDLLLEKYGEQVMGMKTEFGKMGHYFNAGVAWSLLFMIVQFAASFK